MTNKKDANGTSSGAVSTARWQVAPEIPFNAEPVVSPLLFFSDNPENITSQIMGTGRQGLVLWEQRVTGTGPRCSFRAFFWHVNGTDEPLVIGLTLRNLDTESDLVVRRGSVSRTVDTRSGDYFKAGQRIALESLGGTGEPFPDADLWLPAGEDGSDSGSTVVLDQASLCPGDHFFACYEGTVERADGLVGPVSFELRSATGRSNIVGDLAEVLPAEPAEGGDLYGHARGAWPYSRIRIEMVEPFCCTGGAQFARLRLAQRLSTSEGTPDVELFREAAALPYGPERDQPMDGRWIKANKGLYGVDYDPVEIRVRNPLPVQRTIRVSVGTLTPGRTASGLVHGLVGAFDAGGACIFPPAGSKPQYLCSAARDLFPILDLHAPASGDATGSFRLQLGGASTLPWFVVLEERG
ncbi:MAG: hypothetical protein M3Y56_14800 [Armatimonadota bacterium]|nr:hypothetical protein [Armatimonadota bacterium]